MKNSVAIIILLISTTSSFVLGARYGAEAFIQADAKFNASLTTTKLLDIDNQNIERLRTSLEFDRDLSLIRHGEGENNLLVYLWPELLNGENKELGLRSLSLAATYRKSHPTEWSNQKMLKSFEPDIQSEILEHGKILERITDKYAQ